ncbi:hypothetical protein BC829DRAFT_440294 [Chytridium lagenaria]|nr:hypothetical protein BC829DRAFT_440294 [Chytridium lagenaria]
MIVPLFLIIVLSSTPSFSQTTPLPSPIPVSPGIASPNPISPLPPVMSPAPAATPPVSRSPGKVCQRILETDQACGALAPAWSVFTPSEGAFINRTYFPMLSFTCPGMKGLGDVFPVVLCLGALGPCSDASFILPETDSNGIPKNFSQVSTFYNTAKFREALPSLSTQNILPPCRSACVAVASAITSCTMMNTNFGVSGTADPCEGLPEVNCVNRTMPGSPVVSVGGQVANAMGGGAPSVLNVKPGGAERMEGGKVWVFAGFAIAAYLFL